MDVSYINPFVASTVEAFSSMLSCKLSREAISLNDCFKPQFEVTSIIGLTGEVTGTVVLSLEKNVAISATAELLGERPDAINADVIDATGELANIVAGGAKSRMSQFSLQLALPSVIVGRDLIVAFDSSVKPICIPFTCKWGNLTLEIGFVSVSD